MNPYKASNTTAIIRACSAHPQLLENTTRRNEHSTRIPMAAVPASTSAMATQRQSALRALPSPTHGAARESTQRWCTSVSTNPPLCRYSEHTRQSSPRFPTMAVARTPPRVRVLAKSRDDPRSVSWFKHGLETDLITFFRLHAVEPAACMITRVCTDLSDPCRAGGIGRDAFIYR
jgi:hypothetical protein